MKDHIFELRRKIPIYDWSSQLYTQLSSCEIKARKKNHAWTRLERPWPLRYRCSALPTELSNHLGAGHFVSLVIYPRRCRMKDANEYMEDRIFELRRKIWIYDIWYMIIADYTHNLSSSNLFLCYIKQIDSMLLKCSKSSVIYYWTDARQQGTLFSWNENLQRKQKWTAKSTNLKFWKTQVSFCHPSCLVNWKAWMFPLILQ